MSDMSRFHMRRTTEDSALMARLARVYGLSESGVVRFALRFLAKHGPMTQEETMARNPELAQLIRWHGPDQPVRYIGEQWGPEAFAGRLGAMIENVEDLRGDYLDGITARFGTEPGEGILYGDDGNAILVLATEDDLAD